MEARLRPDGIVLNGDPVEIAKFMMTLYREYGQMVPFLRGMGLNVGSAGSSQGIMPGASTNAAPALSTPPEVLSQALRESLTAQLLNKAESVSREELEKALKENPNLTPAEFALKFLGGAVDFTGRTSLYNSIYFKIRRRKQMMGLRTRPRSTAEVPQ